MENLVLVLLAAAPMANVWPYQAKHLPDGRVEYAYDLSLVKASQPGPEALAANGEKALKAFLAQLPRETRVTVKPGAPVTVGGGRGLEPTPLVSAFAQISDAPYASSDPLGRTPKARLHAPLAPEEPKVLLPAEAVLWRVRRFEDGAMAALLLDSDALGAGFWAKVVAKAQQKRRSLDGDGAEGAMLLAARVLAASATLERGRVDRAALSDGAFAQAVDEQLAQLKAHPDALLPWRYEGWTPELKQAAVRQRLFGLPLPTSRTGAAAALVFLDLLKGDKALDATWARLRARRDATLLPVKEPLLDWQQLAKGNPAEALEGMAGFLDALGRFDGPPLLASSTTPARHFLTELEGQARTAAVDELVAAAGDGRLAGEQKPDAPVAVLFDWALGALPAVEEAKDLSTEASWRDHRVSAFPALLGLHREMSDGSNDLPEYDDEKSELRVRLMLPPDLDAEPSPVAYQREVVALERLSAVFAAQGLCNLRSVTPEGGRAPQTVCAEAKSWAATLRGLSHLLDGGGDPKELASARRFAAQWRSDAGFRADVREASAMPVPAGSKRLQSAVVGVGRRELSVAFSQLPALDGAAKDGFEVFPAEQRYLVPELVTKGAWADAAKPPMERAALRSLCDAAKGDPSEIEGAFTAAFK